MKLRGKSSHKRINNIRLRVSKIANQVKTPADKPDSLCSIPKTHMVEGDNVLSSCSLISMHILWCTQYTNIRESESHNHKTI